MGVLWPNVSVGGFAWCRIMNFNHALNVKKCDLFWVSQGEADFHLRILRQLALTYTPPLHLLSVGHRDTYMHADGGRRHDSLCERGRNREDTVEIRTHWGREDGLSVIKSVTLMDGWMKSLASLTGSLVGCLVTKRLGWWLTGWLTCIYTLVRHTILSNTSLPCLSPKSIYSKGKSKSLKIGKKYILSFFLKKRK